MDKRFLFRASVIGILLSGISYLFIANFKLIPSGDETISYLCATGNQQNYQLIKEKGSLYGKVTDAFEWKQLLANHRQSLGNISKDLIETDLHPPLYFWLLHFFTLLPFSLFTSGMLFNFLVHVSGLFILLCICRQFQLNTFVGLFVITAWCISPAILAVGFYARQYELLGLFNLLSFYFYVRYTQSEHIKHLFSFIVCLIGGMLTQYLFVYFAFSYAALAWLVNKKRTVFFKVCIAIGITLLLVYIVHPGVLHQFGTQQARAQPVETGNVVTRIGKTILSFIQVFIPVMNMKVMLLALPKAIISAICGAIFIAAGIIAFRKRKQLYLFKNFQIPIVLLWMLALSITLIVLPYLLFFTPMHAMGKQYFVLVYPYLIIICGIIFSKHIKLFAAAVSLLIVGFGIEILGFYREQRRYEPLIGKLSQSEFIIVNTVNRRAFPRLIPYLTTQKILLDENADPVLIRSSKTLFIAEENTRPSDVNNQVVYDLNDGVVLYTIFKP